MSLAESVLTERDRRVLADLESLTRETYQLWNETWVGFSWRNYTYDHVSRVRNLARSVASREGGDVRTLEFAAILHDITKSYDGEILMRDGQRVLDADGFWINAKLPPARQNRITVLYDSLNLEGTVHHHSGGQIAIALLADHGYDAEFCENVREMIAAHLKPQPTSSRAGLSLYDADTVDANIGLPAFYRNIQISMHRMESDYAKRGEDLTAYLAQNLQDYLTSYLGERIPTWNEGKRRDFAPKLWTETGRQVAHARVDYLADEVEEMVHELDDYAYNVEHGRLAIVRHFMTSRDNPSLTSELVALRSWAQEPNTTTGARGLLERLHAEVRGEL